MILCRKLIEGNVFVSEEESGIFEYYWLDSIQEGYEQVLVNNSDILGIDQFMKRVKNSYSFSRWEMNALLISRVNANFSNWVNGLTNEEKKVVCKHILAPYNLRLMFFTDYEDKVNTKKIITQTLIDRQGVIESMREEVYEHVRIGQMTLAQSQEMGRDVKSMVDNYIMSADPTFKLWVLDPNGFESKSYFSQDLKDDILYIYNYY